MNQDLDDLELIKIVEQNECLYSKNQKSYRNVDKGAIWDQVGSMFTNKKTGDAALKRWETLRTLWSRTHKKRREYTASGSGAKQDTQDFMYYGEMSFLTPHYVPRITKSNMKKTVSSCTASYNAASASNTAPINTAISIPSATSSFSTGSSSEAEQCAGQNLHSIWNLDIIESLSSGTDDSCISPLPSSQSPSPAALTREGHSVTLDFVSPFSSSALKTAGGTSNQKYKKRTTEMIIPESDTFHKKRKADFELLLGSSTKTMERVVGIAEKMLSQKTAAQTLNSADADISVTTNYLTVAMKSVPQHKQLECMMKILQVIQEFSQQ